MAAGSPGSIGNAEWGFVPSDTSRVTIGATSVGFLQGDVGVSVPREYAFLTLDQAVVDLSGVCIRKSFIVSFAMGEPLMGNLQDSWDNDAPAAGPPLVLTIDDDVVGAQALIANTKPPNDEGGNDTRVISVLTALAIGEGPYVITNARGGAPQSIGAQYKAIASSAALLATVTDTYNA